MFTLMTLKAKKKRYIHQLLVSRSSRPKIHSNKSRSMRSPPPCTDLCFCKDLGNMENQLPKKWKKMSSSPRNSFNHNDKNLSLFILQMYFLITLLYTSRSKQQLKITGRISVIHLTVWHTLILWMLVSTDTSMTWWLSQWYELTTRRNVTVFFYRSGPSLNVTPWFGRVVRISAVVSILFHRCHQICYEML